VKRNANFKNLLNFVLILLTVGAIGCKVKIQEETSRVIQPERMRVTNDPWPEHDVAWSPDGARIAFVSERVVTALYKFSLIEKREVGKLGEIFDQIEGKAALSPDGQTLAYFSVNRRRKIWLFNFQAKTEKALFIGHNIASEPAWSHDGEWLAYSAWDSVAGRWSIWTIQSNGENARLIASTAGMLARAPAVAGRHAIGFSRYPINFSLLLKIFGSHVWQMAKQKNLFLHLQMIFFLLGPPTVRKLCFTRDAMIPREFGLQL
jgi:hypothetical protein